MDSARNLARDLDCASDHANDGHNMHNAQLNNPPYEAVVRHELNDSGRDFVVGDIHGMFASLEELLEKVDFDETKDRLFSVGDLVDRGPDSKRSLEWLAKPWFSACRGNHEQFALDAGNEDQYELWVNHNGGEWWLDVDENDRKRFVESFAQMPMAMEVETNAGRIGIVHADVPREQSWDSFMELLKSGNESAKFFAMWSRNRIASVDNAEPVKGDVERIYCGHTPTRDVVQVHNVYYIDTGAVYYSDGYDDARLTMVQIQPTPHQVFNVYTRESS
jgi:serine/threonine protein phosphatase 1